MAIAAAELFSLGELIAKARKDAGIDQSELAEYVGVTRTTISRWERGLGEPTVSEFRRIAERTDARWLFAQFSSYLTRHLEAVPMPIGQMELALPPSVS